MILGSICVGQVYSWDGHENLPQLFLSVIFAIR